MSEQTRACLMRQFDTAWALASYHLDGLTTEECLWRPGRTGLHVTPGPQGMWQAAWPEHEAYSLGPPSMAWITWHMGFWWSMVLDHSFGNAQLQREDVTWPGTAEASRAWIGRLSDQWRTAIERLDDAEFLSAARTRWPFSERVFGDVVGWVNVELTKNAAELGYARFLYAVRDE